MKADLRELFAAAEDRGCAIPAFNWSDIWELLGILDAAEAERSPVIVQTIAPVVEAFGLPVLVAQADALGAERDVPVILHLDHCRDAQKCREAIDTGYDSVMIDASAKPLAENIELCKEICAHAEERRVAVEGEIGHIRGTSAEGQYAGADYLADTEEAVRIARESGITSLAVGIGNAHGIYSERPKLRLDRLREICEAVEVPLVLHGGSGLPEEDVRACIENGIRKVNVGTDLHRAYAGALREKLTAEPGSHNIPALHDPARAAVCEEARRWIRVCGSSGMVQTTKEETR